MRERQNPSELIRDFEAIPPEATPNPAGVLPWTALIGAVLVVVALLGLAAAAPSAHADGDGHRRGYDRDRGGVSFSIGVEAGRRSRNSGFSVGVRYDHSQRDTVRRVRTFDHVDRQGYGGRRGSHALPRVEPVHRRVDTHRNSRYDHYRDDHVYESRRTVIRHDPPRRVIDRHVERHVNRPVVRHQPRGYWRNQWCPPVYRTVYDRCGTPRRVCVRPGSYQRVWVRIEVGGHH